jgi:hypothetical protein
VQRDPPEAQEDGEGGNERERPEADVQADRPVVEDEVPEQPEGDPCDDHTPAHPRLHLR